jgi:hypothetical protein
VRTLMIYQHSIIPTLIFSKISNESPLLSRGLHPRASQSSKYRKTENYDFKITVLAILTTLFNYCTYVKLPTNEPLVSMVLIKRSKSMNGYPKLLIFLVLLISHPKGAF